MTYLCNVILNPLEHLSLIQQARIQIAVFSHRFTGEKSQCTDSIIEVHKNDAPARRLYHLGAVEEWAERGISAALDEKPHREL